MAALAEVSSSGRKFSQNELALIQEMVEACGGLSRGELANTVCELLDWKRKLGGLKTRECRDLLENLDKLGYIRLPEKKPAGRPRGSRTSVPVTGAGEPQSLVVGTVRDIGPIEMKLARSGADKRLFRELVGRHHYLGYKVPFGARLSYLVTASRPRPMVLGALQFSSPAWRMAARDIWIGWDEDTRQRNLQRVVNQSRFLLLPWIKVKNLASTVLSHATRALRTDWPEAYGMTPLLIETLVDVSRYSGLCYRASNWLEIGLTSGRGRMDSRHQRHGDSPKAVFVYPVVPDAARLLREG